MLKQCKTLKYCLETVNEIIKLVKNSPKRDAEFQRLKQAVSSESQASVYYVPQDGLFVHLPYKVF